MAKHPHLFNAEALIKCTARQAARGDAIGAERTLRSVERLLMLEHRFKQRGRQNESQRALGQEHALARRQAELDARHVELNQREFALACEAEKLNELKAELEALYEMMYNKTAD